MGHHAGQFGFFLGAENQAAVYIKETAGKSESVDLVRVNHLDGEGNLGVGVAHEVLPDAVYVFGDDRIINQLGGTLDFLGKALAQSDFLLNRKPVHFATDFAIADGLDVFLSVLRIDGIFLLHGLFSGSGSRLLSLRLRGLLRRRGLGGVLLRRILALRRCEGRNCQEGAA